MTTPADLNDFVQFTKPESTEILTTSFKQVKELVASGGGGGGDLLAANNLSDLESASSARDNLELGTLATQNGTFSGSSSGSNTGDQQVFKNIAVPGQSNIVADSAADTLTFAAGENISITTDPETDTITITAASDIGDLLAANNLSDLEDVSIARDNLELGTLATQSGTFSGSSSGTNTGDQLLFKNVAVSGQGDIIADTTADTLTFVAGSNMTITTDPATDSVTFAATAPAGVTAADIQKATYITATATTSGDALTATITPAITAYTDGMIVALRVPYNWKNSGVPTLSLNGLTARNIKTPGFQFPAGALAGAGTYLFQFDSDNLCWRYMNPSIHTATVNNVWKYAVDSSAVVNSFTITEQYNTFTVSAGTEYFFKATLANTGATILKFSGSTIANTAIKKLDGTDTVAGDIPANHIVHVVHNGTYWILQNPATLSPLIRVRIQTGTTYTMAAVDVGANVVMTNNGPLTFTLPQQSSVALLAGANVLIKNAGSGNLTLATQGSDTISGNGFINAGNYAKVILRTVSPNVWDVYEGNVS